ncbi:MAG: thiamine pyrophosphate-dependent dehydrogenase E1 component subunit alpha [Candidatus Latescibacteria bacterium]|nr:thiamine pyrophosphate-dependent dehydrogenase E1 component subunit alpha [Candidatus Latescibacterota bacterium]
MSVETAPVTESDLRDDDLEDLRLSAKDYHELYHIMCLQREFETRLYTLFKQGRLIGAAYAGAGHEAIAAGSGYAMAPQDVLVPLHRTIGTHFLRGHTPRIMMCQYMGRANSPTGGKDGNMHCGDIEKNIIGMTSHLGANIPTAAGIALGLKLQKKDGVALSFIGEGGTSIGDFHEGLNFAAVRKLPMVLIIENNGFAYSTPTELEYACENLVDRAEGYGMEGVLVDGTDVRAVYRATKDAFARARAGAGPTLIEAKTYRLLGHSQQDPAKYVPQSYKDAAKQNDPLPKCERDFVKSGYCTQDEMDVIKSNCVKEIDDAVAFAESSPMPEPAEALTGVYAV